MKILVTGGAGYLGSILVPALLMNEFAVTVVDNLMYQQTPFNLHCFNPNFDFVKGDARDERVMRPLLKIHDVAIFLAALVGAPLCNLNQQGAISTNLHAVTMALSLLSREQEILIPITNSGYGVGEPGKECTEESPLNPISLYGQTKVDAEKAVMDRGNAISFRLATVFGMSPRMRLDLLVNDMVYRAITDRAVVLFESNFIRNYIHIRDVAYAFIHGLDNFNEMKDQVYNVGLSDANLSKMQLCQKIKEHLPDFQITEAASGKDIDQRNYVVSNTKIERTGFKPKYALDDGIKELIKGYKMLSNNRYGNV